MTGNGLISVLPPVVAIVAAVATRRATLSLLVGVWAAGVIVTDSVGVRQTGSWIMTAAAGHQLHVQVIAFTLLLGAATAMIWRLGGSHAIREWARNWVNTRRKAGVMAWLLGLALFFDRT